MLLLFCSSSHSLADSIVRKLNWARIRVGSMENHTKSVRRCQLALVAPVVIVFVVKDLMGNNIKKICMTNTISLLANYINSMSLKIARTTELCAYRMSRRFLRRSNPARRTEMHKSIFSWWMLSGRRSLRWWNWDIGHMPLSRSERNSWLENLSRRWCMLSVRVQWALCRRHKGIGTAKGMPQNQLCHWFGSEWSN